MWIPFLALTRKDLKLFFSDRRAVLMSIVAPIIIASFFGYIFGGSSPAEPSPISVLVADLDNSPISRELLSRVAADKSLDVKPSTPERAREAVRQGKTVVAFIIPKDFGAEAGQAFFRTAQKPEIAVLYDPSHRTELAMVQGILSGHVMEAVSKEMFDGPTGHRVVQDSLTKLGRDTDMAPDLKKSLTTLLRGVEDWNATQDARQKSGAETPTAGLTLPYQVHAEAVTSRSSIPYNGYAHAFAGMGVQFILFVGIEVGIGLLLQRQSGVWKRLRAAPISRAVVLGSRALSAAITSMFVLMVLFAFARVVFGVRVEGSVAGFLGVCAAFSLMTASFGLLIAALGKTPEATRGLAIVATLLMVMLGGAWVPTFVFPHWLQQATVVVPTRWAVDGLDATTWRGLGFSAAALPIALLLGCSVLCGTLAVMRFRWEADG